SSYPLISAQPNKNCCIEVPVEYANDVHIDIKMCQNNDDAVFEAINRAAQGQHVLWIENSVAEAQHFYKLLAVRCSESELDIEIGLVHSRFIRADRESSESKWVSLFGK